MASTVCGITPSSAATKDDDVGHLSTASSHRGERLVARRVDEGEEVAVPVDLIGTDVLGDPAGLARHDVGLADPVQEQGLAVVDMAHHRDHRRARAEVLLFFLVLLLEVARQELGLGLLAGVDQTDVGPELSGEQLDHVVGERLGGRDHLALQQQEPDDVSGRSVQLGTEVAGRRAPLDDDLAFGHRRVRGHVRGQLGRFQLLQVPTTTSRPPLGRSATPTREATAASPGTPGAHRAAGTRAPGEPPGRAARESSAGAPWGTAGRAAAGSRRIAATRAR